MYEILYHCVSCTFLLYLLMQDILFTHVLAAKSRLCKQKEQLLHCGKNHLETLSWAVKLNVDTESHHYCEEEMHFTADLVAMETGLVNQGQIASLKGHYSFTYPLNSSVTEFLNISRYDSYEENFGSHGIPYKSSHVDYNLEDDHVLYQHPSVQSSQFEMLKSAVHDILDEHEQVQWHMQQIVRQRKTRGILASIATLNSNLFPSQVGDFDKMLKPQRASSEEIQQRVLSSQQEFSSEHFQDTQISRSGSELKFSSPSEGQAETDNENNLNGFRKLLPRSLLRHIEPFLELNHNFMHLEKKRWERDAGLEQPLSSPLHFQDPAFPQQWHLINTATPGLDVNVTGVWDRNITGEGVTVVVLDDGLEWTNPDIQDNYSKEGSWDLNSNDNDPMPRDTKAKNRHGTRCAGEIAATPNNVCGVGVAYGAKVAGIRMLDGPLTDSLEATAFNKNMQINDIYSCSWGPDDDGKSIDGPHYLAMAAMKHGVDFGRAGYGNIYVVASGNGGMNHDNCNFDGYANSIHTVTIGAVDETGSMPYYAEECASMLAVTFSSGGRGLRNIVTTDWEMLGGTGCTEEHTGTSAAAPIAAGLIALMLQARPCLTWRDIQYLIIMTAVKVDKDIAHWYQNKAGFHHSHKHGFGLMDAWRLVNAAKVWESVPWLTSFMTDDLKVDIPIKSAAQPTQVYYKVDRRVLEGYNLYSLEYVQVKVTLPHKCRGDLQISLRCPSGTESILATIRPLDKSEDGFKEWTFSTVRCWGEEPKGTYTLTIQDLGINILTSRGKLANWKLMLYGSPMFASEIIKRRELVEEATSGKFLNDNFTLPCRPPESSGTPFSLVYISERILKILLLSSVFALALAIYESFESLFCFNDVKEKQRKYLKTLHRSKHTGNSTTEGEEPSERTGLLLMEEEETSFNGADNVQLHVVRTEPDWRKQEDNKDLTSNSHELFREGGTIDESHVLNNHTANQGLSSNLLQNAHHINATNDTIDLYPSSPLPLSSHRSDQYPTSSQTLSDFNSSRYSNAQTLHDFQRPDQENLSLRDTVGVWLQPITNQLSSKDITAQKLKNP